MLIYIIVLHILLSGEGKCVEIENKIRTVLQTYEISSLRGLEALAENQCVAIATFNCITEVDLAGRNFAQRLRLIGVNPTKSDLDEVYFRIYDEPDLIVDFILYEVKKAHPSHYGLAVKKVGKVYFVVFTFGDLRQVT